MVELYYDLVLAHKRTCDPNNTSVKQVPANLHDDVLALLTANGYDANGYKVDNKSNLESEV